MLENVDTIDRTEWYHVISHPYLFFDGRDPVIGAADCLNALTNYQSHFAARMAATGGESPIAIEGESARVGDELIVVAHLTNVDGVPNTSLQATLLVYEDDVAYCCGPGGNSIWDGVVRAIHDQPLIVPTDGTPVTVAHSFTLDPTWDPDHLRVVAYIQDSTTREIVQGHRVVAPLAGIEPGAERGTEIVVTPNPCLGSFVVTWESGSVSDSDPDRALLRLGLFDAAGRRVADWSGAGGPPARRRLEWNPGDLGRGVFYLEAVTTAGVARTRVLRLR
ncbi:MAG: hypothetical protein IPK72_11415 [Candidatus Eisenbacteria bacterium]|nr:hypothetical protein [Candidatus Eisenbacteria bacterium]